jgi:capsular exopolysaccharide synthesis family protein
LPRDRSRTVPLEFQPAPLGGADTGQWEEGEMSLQTMPANRMVRRYAAVVWRWLWLLVLCAVIAGVGAYEASRWQHPVYRASALLLVNQRAPGQDAYSALLASDQLVQTYLTLINQPAVLQGAVHQVGGVSSASLAKSVHVSNAAGTQTIQIAVDDTNPARAAKLANAIAAVFIQQQQQAAQAQFSSAQKQLTQLITELSGQVNTLTAQVNALQAIGGTDPRLPGLNAQLTGALARRDALETQSDDLTAQELVAHNNLQIIQPAIPPTAPDHPIPVLNATIGAVLGLIVAIGLVVLLEFLDDRVRTPHQVEELLDLPIIGALRDHRGGRVLLNGNNRSHLAQSLSALSSNLSLGEIEKPLRSIVVTSATEGEGKTTLAVNLALSLAHGGRRVVLVDADLQHPQIHWYLGIPNAGGLSHALTAQTSIATSDMRGVPNLRVLTAGSHTPNGADLLSPNKVRWLLQALMADGTVDVVVLDTAPAATSAGAAVLASLADGTVLVVDGRRSREKALLRAKDMLRRVHAHVIGVVLNHARVKPDGYSSGQVDRRWPSTVEQAASHGASPKPALRA